MFSEDQRWLTTNRVRNNLSSISTQPQRIDKLLVFGI